MFDLTHILYMVISGIITTVGLWAAARYIKIPKHKDILLKISAISTVVLHYSNIWVDFFSNGGTAVVENNHILMVYPCNIIMWFLFAVALSDKKDSLIIRILTEFTFWGGIICGSIGIIFNINYANNPSLLDYGILKGLLSHSTMLFGCIYLLVGGYFKIRVFNVLSCILGLLFFIVDGLAVNCLYKIFEIPQVDAMFLETVLIPEYPWISVHLLAAIAVLILFACLALYEKKCLPEDERWDTRLRKYINEKRGNTK